jgi:poly-gamma-glutamate capsule biosynthesis protein CapA/YwtB (metallophosphatase superfamily)
MKKYATKCIVFLLLLSACEYSRPINNTPHTLRKHTVITAHKLPVDNTICIAAVGDIMLGSSYPSAANLPPDSGKNSFKAVLKDLRTADITFGNLEGTLLDTGAPIRYKNKKLKPYLFRMPVNYVGVLKDAGFDVVSLANNHINDFADAGRLSTVKTLNSYGIAYAGLQNHQTTIITSKGVRYGFCAFAPNSHTVSIHDLKNAANIIARLKNQTDIVIVSFHGGGEGVGYEHVPFKTEKFIGENRGNVFAFAHNAIDAGADVVFGNGPHVSRGIEKYKSRLIAYSLGNFCTYKCVSVAGICGMAPLLKVNLNKKGEFVKGHIISLIQSHLKGLELDTLNKAAARIKMLTEADFKQPGVYISNDGTITND